MGDAHGGASSAQVTISCLDSIAVAVDLEAEEGAGAGLWSTLGFVEMAHVVGPTAGGNQGPRGGSRPPKLMIGLIGRVVATVEAVGWLPLRLRYHRIYSIRDTDASISGLCTEFTSV